MNYKKISSILFAKQEPLKVEFAFAGDSLVAGLKAQAGNMNRNYAQLVKFASDLEIMKEKADEAVRVYKSLTSNGAELASDADNLLSVMSKKAQELGVDINSVPNFGIVKDALNALVDAQQSSDGAFEQLKKQL